MKSNPLVVMQKSLAASIFLLGFSEVISQAPVAHAVERVASASVFAGSYSDPNHPGCKRDIQVKGNEVTIFGSDNADGSGPWVLKAKAGADGKMLVDFSPKGGPKDLLGVFDVTENCIQWPDGNKWTKL